MDYCVYALSLPIVSEGGFSCPAEMQFQIDLGSHRVCSDHPLDPASLPPQLCSGVQGVCSQEAPRPARSPGPAEVERESSGTPQPVDSAQRTAPGSWSECGDSTLEMGLTGDRCPNTTVPFGCGRSTVCGATFAMCPEGILQATELEILDCSLDVPPTRDEGPPRWSGVADCSEALRDGASFQACEGPFVCAERTDDPCCVDYALCLAEGPSPTNVLVRYQFCERGCSQVQPSSELEPVRSCDYFAGEGVNDNWPDELRLADLPCEGDFICWNDQDLSGAGSDVLQTEVGVLRWCSEGIVRGQHSTISNLFVPTR